MSKYEKLKKLAKQPSTWKGISVIVGALGFALNPAIPIAAAFIFGIIDIFRDEDKV